MEASECFLYFLPERNSGSLRFVFSLLPFREVRRSADGGGDLFWLQGTARGFPVLRPFWPTVWPFLGKQPTLVIEVGERSVAQKLKLVFYSDDG